MFGKLMLNKKRIIISVVLLIFLLSSCKTKDTGLKPSQSHSEKTSTSFSYDLPFEEVENVTKIDENTVSSIGEYTISSDELYCYFIMLEIDRENYSIKDAAQKTARYKLQLSEIKNTSFEMSQDKREQLKSNDLYKNESDPTLFEFSEKLGIRPEKANEYMYMARFFSEVALCHMEMFLEQSNKDYDFKTGTEAYDYYLSEIDKIINELEYIVVNPKRLDEVQAKVDGWKKLTIFKKKD